MPNPSTTTESPANTKEKKTAYLICEGALCECDAGTKPVKLKVDSHKKAYINDNKLVATVKDVTFELPTAPFVTCKNIPSQNKTCQPKFEQWTKPYKDIEVEGNAVITDKSELKCMEYGGTITILKHGQTQDVNAEQANNMDRTIAAQVNALADLAPIAEEDKKVSVLSITGALVDDPKYKPVTTQENKSIVSITEEERLAHKQIEDPADIYVRPGQEVKFIAKPKGTESLVCWKVSGTKDPIHFLQHGPSYQTSFPEVGKYSVEGYGTGKDSFLDIETRLVNGKREDMKEYKDCMLDILVQENKLIDIRHLKSDNIIDVTNKKIVEKAQLRIGVPATFEPVFLMPPIQNEIDELILVIFDESGTELQRTKGQPKLVFVPKNSAAKYTLKAYFDGAEADFISYPFASSLNSVNVIATSNMKVENERIRPGTFVKFTVQNSKFMDDTVAPEIIETENRQIKWYENSETVAGTGPSYEKTYQKEGKYTIVCRVTEGQPGWFTADKNDADDRTFYVTKNYPTAIEKTTTGISKVGRKISFELKGFFNIDYTDKNTIHWELIGPETKETKASPTFEFTPTKKGTYYLYVSMNGGATEHPFKFECTACEIVKGWWTDSDGNMLTGKDDTSDPSNTLGVAGWGQEVCIAFKHIGLGGEVVTIEVWDKDFNGTTSVYTTELTCTEGYNAVKYPLTLDNDLKKEIAKKGASSNGLLYFTVTVNNGLKVVNNGMVLPVGEINYLKIDDTPRAKAYFADNNDTKRYSTASTDMPVYVQVKSRNLIGEDLELVVHKTICWGISKPYNEKVTFRVDEYGMASVKLDMCIFNEEFSNPNDSIPIFVKVHRKSNSKELYSSDGKYPLTLYDKLNTSPASSNTTKAFVLVDTCEGGKNKVCECKKYDLIWGNKVSCDFRKKVVQISKNLGLPQKDYEGANWLMAVMALETSKTFDPSITNNQGYTGLIQIGKDAATSIGTSTDKLKQMDAITQLDYVEKYFKKYKNKLTTLTDIYLSVLYPSASGHGNENDYIVFDDSSTGIKKKAYLQNPTFHQEEDEITKTSSGKIIARNGKIDGKTYIWEIALSIKATETNGLGNKYDYSKCNNLIVLNAKDVITFRIYSDGKIEKHIPSIIKDKFKSKYKYVYHDKNNKEHEVVTCDFSIVDKRANGVEVDLVPSGYESTYNYPAGGNAQIAYVYKNNDIIVTGTEYGIRKYPKGTGKVELLKMPDSLSYLNGNVKIYYTFKNSQRRYCNPDAFAAFIGVLAEIDRTDVECTGMCFSDSTSYPSLSHPNGDSVDTVYFKTLEEEQKKVNAFIKFNFTHIYRGNGSWYAKLKETAYSIGHEDHLHSGEFNVTKIKIIGK